MTTLQTPTATPTPVEAPAVGTGERFENIRLVLNEQTGAGPTGTLIASGDTLFFHGDKGAPAAFPKVRRITYAGQVIVEFGGDGRPKQKITLVDTSRGMMHFRAADKELAEKLRAAVTVVPWTAEEQAEIVRGRHRNGRKRMLIGAALFAVGAIVTIVTYSNATDGSGGRYFLWWGPMVFGLILFIQGLAASLSRR